jgi:hypothetical protein
VGGRSLHGGLLGGMQISQDGANAWVERIVARGWGKLNLHSATALLWHRVHRGWRPVLVAYVLIMAFTLVYTAEHCVVDIVLGWALAAAVIWAINRYDAWRRERTTVPTVEAWPHD